MTQPSRTRRILASALRIVAMLAASALLVLAWLGLMTCMPGSANPGPPPPLDQPGQVLREALRADVTYLAETIGERSLRVPPQLQASADWLAQQLRAAGWTVTEIPYTCRGHTVRNLVAERRGTALPGEIVVLGAHYDSVERSPGADDNASGVAALLAVARALGHSELPRTVRLVAFVNEEPPWFRGPLMGSRIVASAFAKAGDTLSDVLVLDAIGFYCSGDCQAYPPPLSLFYPSEGRFVAFVGRIQDWWRLRHAVGLFRAAVPMPSEGLAAPRVVPGIDYSDHMAFWDVGYPGLLITDAPTYRNPAYHRSSDLPATLDWERLAWVTRGLIAVVRQLATAT
ncbi:MAG: M28 family peptidase [Deltaproteobacteria bacterium]|nr:M28 family peptidase [Deltaproteobacteria bacterium]